VKPTDQQLDVFIDLLVEVVVREMRAPKESRTPEMQTPTQAFDGGGQASAEAERESTRQFPVP
jgi:hypothetical protein